MHDPTRESGRSRLAASRLTTRALWISALTLVFFVGYGAIPVWVRGSQRLLAAVDPAMLNLFQSIAWGSAAGWLVFIMRGWYLIHRRIDDRLYSHLVVHFYAISNMLLVYCVGVTTIVAGLFVLGALAAGALIFGPTRTAAGLATGLITVGAATWIGRQGWLPRDGLLESRAGSAAVRAPEVTYVQLIAIGGLTAVFVSVLVLVFARASGGDSE